MTLDTKIRMTDSIRTIRMICRSMGDADDTGDGYDKCKNCPAQVKSGSLKGSCSLMLNYPWKWKVDDDG